MKIKIIFFILFFSLLYSLRAYAEYVHFGNITLALKEKHIVSILRSSKNNIFIISYFPIIDQKKNQFLFAIRHNNLENKGRTLFIKISDKYEIDIPLKYMKKSALTYTYTMDAALTTMLPLLGESLAVCFDNTRICDTFPDAEHDWSDVNKFIDNLQKYE